VADAAAEGHLLDRALRDLVGGRESPALVWSTDPAVRVEAVKLAEDRSGDLIVRLYESSGGRRGTVIGVDAPVTHVEVVDLLERPFSASAPPGVDPRLVELELRPFQILTLRYRVTPSPSR
jgi:alpha-mannosidase